VVGGIEFAIEFPEVEMTAEMAAKIEKEIAGLEKELAGVDGRLGNAQFVEKAPARVIEGAKTRRVEIVDRLTTLRRNLSGETS
jgi:valyl-tRNA synthetase